MAISTGHKKIKTAVFISGTGSNLKNLIKFSKLKISPISINLVISNNYYSKGLRFAKIFEIRKYVLDLVLCHKVDPTFTSQAHLKLLIE